MTRGLRMTEEQLRDFVARGQRAQTTVDDLRDGNWTIPEFKEKRPKKNKYNAQIVNAGGEGRFASKKEYRVWCELKLRKKAGEIIDLRRQVKFSLFANQGEHIATYCSDFCWNENGKFLVADCKSEPTRKRRDWVRVKKMMLACHGHRIIEL